MTKKPEMTEREMEEFIISYLAALLMDDAPRDHCFVLQGKARSGMGTIGRICGEVFGKPTK